MDSITKLGEMSAHLAMKGAVDFLHSRRIALSDVDVDALVVALKKQTKLALDDALRDATEAYDAGMKAIGDATFAASMTNAGIAAAKEVVRV